MAALSIESNDNAPAQKGPQVGAMVSLPELPPKERKRRQTIADTWKAYKGEWGTGPLKVQPGEADDNVRPNVCQPIVDVGVNFLFGEVVRIEVANDTDGENGDEVDVDNGSSEGTSPAQAYLDECWGDDDDKMTLLTELAMNGALAGSAFVMLDPANKQAGQDCPRIIVLDPANVTVIADPHDCKVAREYWIQYDVESYDLRTGQPETVTYRKVITRNDPDGLAATTDEGYDADDSWLILDFERRGSGKLSRGGSGETGAWRCTARTDWPRPYPPIVDCQNLPAPNEYWGLSDLPHDLIGLNRALIFNESNILRTVKHYVAPMRYASGVTANTVSTGPDKMLLLQDKDAKISAVDVKADLANAMAYSEALLSHMDEQSQIPGIALGRMKDIPRGQITGPVFQALYKPPMAKTVKKRRLYGRLIREICLHLLDLGGFSEATKAKIILHWKDVMPSDELVEAQTAQIWNGLGVSKDSLMQRYTTFDPDTEAEKNQQEQVKQLSLFSQGQGMPPMDMQALAKSADMNSDEEGGESPNAQPKNGKQQNTTPQQQRGLNSPAARLQRARVAATAKG